MGILHLILHTLNSLILQKKESIEQENEFLLVKKRALFHNKIPDLKTVQTEFGEQYFILKSIIDKLDPIVDYKISEYPNKYELLTKTLIYQLKNKKTKKEIDDLTEKEFNLWFGRAKRNKEQFEKVLIEIYNFKQNHKKTWQIAES